MTPSKESVWIWCLILLGATVFVVTAAWVSPQKAAAFDEQFHLAAGYSYLKTGDFRIASTHPPLIGLLAAWRLRNDPTIQLPLEQSGWQNGDRFVFSDQWLWRSGNDAHRLLVTARWSIILLGGSLLIVLGVWLRDHTVPLTPWVAVWVIVLTDPNLQANSRLVTTDLGLTAFLFFTIFAYQSRYRTHPTSPNAILVGVLAGLTMTTKYTGLIVWPILFLLLFLFPIPGNVRQLVEKFRYFLVMLGSGLLILWIVYLFDFGPASFGNLQISLPAPFYWTQLWNTFVKLPQESAQKLSFLLGSSFPGGVWYYFPIAFLVKMPLAFLILTAGGIWHFGRHDWRDYVALWLPAAVFLLLGLTGVLTIGFRHMLPAVPFLCLIAGKGAQQIYKLRHGPWILLGLVILQIVEIGRIWPHQEAFFNLLAGRWQNWGNVLVDSNLDWGQDLIYLKRSMATNHIDQVNLAYFGTASPEHYDVKYAPLPGYIRFGSGYEIQAYNPLAPTPGWYAISATSLQLGLLTPETEDLYAVFREMEPVERAGYSIYLYEIKDSVPNPRPVVVTGQPGYLFAWENADSIDMSSATLKWHASPDTQIVPRRENEFYTGPPLADFGGVLSLIDVLDLPESAAAGQTISFTLVWRVGDQPMPTPAPSIANPLNAFVHVVQQDPYVRIGQFDGWDTALRGLESGDIILQPISIPLSNEAAAGPYQVQIGLYSPQSFERLLQKNENDQEVDHFHAGHILID
ncbi:MAG: hypothetical protein QNJ45_08760 [Ardenticatenaceae bacterium]|nr:hypothetical protein [Ardenticatenaceae bacterium]